MICDEKWHHCIAGFWWKKFELQTEQVIFFLKALILIQALENRQKDTPTTDVDLKEELTYNTVYALKRAAYILIQRRSSRYEDNIGHY